MKYLYHVITVILVMSLVACYQALLPDQVADKFWLAIVANDKEGIKKHSTLFWNAEMIDQQQMPKVESFNLETIVINDNKAEIDTVLYLHDLKDHPVNIITYLIQTDGVWKVNYQKTLQQLEPKKFNDAIEELSELGEKLSDEINRSLDELNEAIPKIEDEITEFEKKLEKGLPEFKQKIDELVKKLEQLLSLPEQQDEKESETTEI